MLDRMHGTNVVGPRAQMEAQVRIPDFYNIGRNLTAAGRVSTQHMSFIERIYAYVKNLFQRPPLVQPKTPSLYEKYGNMSQKAIDATKRMEASHSKRLPTMSFDKVLHPMTEQEKIETAAAFGALANLSKVKKTSNTAIPKVSNKPKKATKTMSFDQVAQYMTEEEKRKTAAAFGAIPNEKPLMYDGL